MNLSSTTNRLTIALGSSPALAVETKVDFTDINQVVNGGQGTLANLPQRGRVQSGTAVNLLDPPAADVTRKVTFINVYNPNTTVVTVIIAEVDGATTTRLITAEVDGKGTLTWSAAGSWGPPKYIKGEPGAAPVAFDLASDGKMTVRMNNSTSIPVNGVVTGLDGASAYQVWLDAGNTGTEAEFLASLAVTGDPGASAYQTWLDGGNSGTEADFIASLQGLPGAGVAPPAAWAAQAYPDTTIVSYAGSSWYNPSAAADSDVPGVSGAWVVFAAKGATGDVTPEALAAQAAAEAAAAEAVETVAGKIGPQGGSLKGALKLGAPPEPVTIRTAIRSKNRRRLLGFDGTGLAYVELHPSVVADKANLTDLDAKASTASVAGKLDRSGGTMTGPIKLAKNNDNPGRRVAIRANRRALLWFDLAGRAGFIPDPDTLAGIVSDVFASSGYVLEPSTIRIDGEAAFREKDIAAILTDGSPRRKRLLGTDRLGRLDAIFTPATIARIGQSLSIDTTQTPVSLTYAPGLPTIIDDALYMDAGGPDAPVLLDDRRTWTRAAIDCGSILAQVEDGGVRQQYRLSYDGGLLVLAGLVMGCVAEGQSNNEVQTSSEQLVLRADFPVGMDMPATAVNNIWLGHITSGGASTEVLASEITGIAPMHGAMGDSTHASSSIEAMCTYLHDHAAANLGGWSPRMNAFINAEGGQNAASLLEGAGAGKYAHANFVTVVTKMRAAYAGLGLRYAVARMTVAQGESDASSTTLGSKHELMRAQRQAAQEALGEFMPIEAITWQMSSFFLNTSGGGVCSLLVQHAATLTGSGRTWCAGPTYGDPYGYDFLHHTSVGHARRGWREGILFDTLTRTGQTDPLRALSRAVTGANQITVTLSEAAEIDTTDEFVLPVANAGLVAVGGTIANVAFDPADATKLIVTTTGAASAVTGLRIGLEGHPGVDRAAETQARTNIRATALRGTYPTYLVAGVNYGGGPIKWWLCHDLL